MDVEKQVSASVIAVPELLRFGSKNSAALRLGLIGAVAFSVLAANFMRMAEERNLEEVALGPFLNKETWL